jgi:hypothetical protein
MFADPTKLHFENSANKKTLKQAEVNKNIR